MRTIQGDALVPVNWTFAERMATPKAIHNKGTPHAQKRAVCHHDRRANRVIRYNSPLCRGHNFSRGAGETFESDVLGFEFQDLLTSKHVIDQETLCDGLDEWPFGRNGFAGFAHGV